jgi:hypothetical protein
MFRYVATVTNPGISERIVTSYVTIWRLVEVLVATVVEAVVAETVVGVLP